VGCFLLAFPPKSYMHSSSPPICATCPAKLIILDLIILIILGEQYKLWSCAVFSSLLPFHSCLVHIYSLPNTLFSDTFSLCSSFNVRDQVSHPYKTTGSGENDMINK
jgi:hypothetical protein